MCGLSPTKSASGSADAFGVFFPFNPACFDHVPGFQVRHTTLKRKAQGLFTAGHWHILVARRGLCPALDGQPGVAVRGRDERREAEEKALFSPLSSPAGGRVSTSLSGRFSSLPYSP